MTAARSRMAVAAALAVLAPAAALACPVCFSASSARTLATYVATAAAMTALPLLIVGGLALWVRRRLRTAAEPRQSCQA
ncbi:MAG TPA: hypothetical protein VFD84_18230 [Candidatus Binatia bacterium]|jgi:hypothetical protein|nr:hypothetical protein [Candidatus Binatia bacterium]